MACGSSSLRSRPRRTNGSTLTRSEVRRSAAEAADVIRTAVGTRTRVILIHLLNCPAVSQARTADVPDATARLVFTSSTTGPPKAVSHSEDTLAALNMQFAERFGLDHRLVSLAVRGGADGTVR